MDRIDDIGNIKTENGTWYKVFWNKFYQMVVFKKSPNDNVLHRGPFARNKDDAIKFAKEEADKIEKSEG